MISRVAECCFWMLRYIERAESMSRLLRVNRSFLLDVDLPQLNRWMPVVIVSGEQERFLEHHSEEAQNDEEVVQDYLTWSDSGVGIETSVYWARENARMIREVISLEMWESINSLWHWLKGGQGRRLYNKDRDDFYCWIKDACMNFHGVGSNTVLRQEPYDFMRVGMLLERAAQTARILDVKYHLLGPTEAEVADSPVESAQWSALLRSCSAEDSFFRSRRGNLSGARVADFLLREASFPRAVLHCLTLARHYLERIETADPGEPTDSLRMLGELVASVEKASIDEVLSKGLHEELTRIINRTTEVCAAIHTDYFNPVFSEQQMQSHVG